MDAYNFDSIRFQTQERLDRRTHDAAAERLARGLRGTTATTRVKERLQASLASRLSRPVFGLASMRVRHS